MASPSTRAKQQIGWLLVSSISEAVGLAAILRGAWLWSRLIATALSQALRYTAIHPAALTTGPWVQGWRDPRPAMRQYICARDGEPTELTGAFVRASRRCFGVEISPQLEVVFQTQNSLTARPGLRQLEFGRSRFDDLGKYDALDVSSAQQFYPSVRTSISEPGFSQTPRAALEETVQSLAVHDGSLVTLGGSYMFPDGQRATWNCGSRWR